MRHDVQPRAGILLVDLFHRAMKTSHDVGAKLLELGHDLHVAEIFLQDAPEIELHQARLFGQESQVLEHVDRVDDFLENFGGETEVGLNDGQALRRRQSVLLAHLVLANGSRSRHHRARPRLRFLDRAALFHHVLRNVRPENFREAGPRQRMLRGKRIEWSYFYRSTDIGIKPSQRLRRDRRQIVRFADRDGGKGQPRRDIPHGGVAALLSNAVDRHQDVVELARLGVFLFLLWSDFRHCGGRFV